LIAGRLKPVRQKAQEALHPDQRRPAGEGENHRSQPPSIKRGDQLRRRHLHKHHRNTALGSSLLHKRRKRKKCEGGSPKEGSIRTEGKADGRKRQAFKDPRFIGGNPPAAPRERKVLEDEELNPRGLEEDNISGPKNKTAKPLIFVGIQPSKDGRRAKKNTNRSASDGAETCRSLPGVLVRVHGRGEEGERTTVEGIPLDQTQRDREEL